MARRGRNLKTSPWMSSRMALITMKERRLWKRMLLGRDAYVLYRDDRLQEEAQVVTRLGLYSKLHKDKPILANNLPLKITRTYTKDVTTCHKILAYTISTSLSFNRG